jgi:hypothetical protein
MIVWSIYAMHVLTIFILMIHTCHKLVALTMAAIYGISGSLFLRETFLGSPWLGMQLIRGLLCWTVGLQAWDIPRPGWAR